ncbi:MAG TPA: hypothetical protein VHL77_08215, partial [Ferruginibacter sp.]|nr:hypothetical protein [Ferruginibacter sp.]
YPGTGAICGEALKHRSRVAIKDVNKVSFIQGRGDMKSFEFSGIRSVQSTPLVSSRGGFVGMISTQWRTPHDFANDDYDSLDQLALFTADLLEKRKMDVVWHD